MKRPAHLELQRLRELPPGEDLVRVAELIQAAAPLPDLGADARQRIRAGLRRDMAATDTRRPRWAFRLSPVMVLLAALVSASVVGAAVRSLLAERRLQRQDGDRPHVSVVDVGPRKSPRRGRAPASSVEPLAPEAPRGLTEPNAPGALHDLPSTPDVTAPNQEAPVVARGPAIPQPLRTAGPPLAPRARTDDTTPAQPSSPPAQTAAPTSPPPVAFAPAPPPAQRPERQPALALATPRKPAVAPDLAPTPRDPAPPSPTEAELLAQVIRILRRNGDANGALALLAQHQPRLASGSLAPEVAAVRIEALLQARRTSAALVELDRFPLDDVPGREEWRIVRAELRGLAGRWTEAERDFSLVLVGTPGSMRDELMERALWGRALARTQQGNAAGAHGDQALYLQRFPDGRFAAQARRALGGPVSNEPRAP